MRTSHSRSVLAVAIVCAAATWASPQVRVVAPGRFVTVPTFRVSVETVVAHVLKFDVDGDGRIRASELPERMAPLIGRGDRNGIRRWMRTRWPQSCATRCRRAAAG